MRMKERFFGMPAVDLHSNRGVLEELRGKLEALMAEGVALDCCLQSYRSRGGEACYHLCQTRLLV